MTRLRTANLLGALAGEVVDRVDRRLRRHPNQTDSAAAALNFLSLWSGCSNAQLARALGLSHPATVRLVDKLEAEGLVESRPGDDRRAVSLTPTDAGRARARSLLVERCAALSEVIDALTSAEQDQLAGLLEKLLRAVTTGVDGANHICRLCDEIACPGADCPVHQTALAYLEPAQASAQTGI